MRTPAPSAQVAPVQAAPVGGMNLNPQLSGITTPALGATQGKSLPGWICWSTILIGLLSLILYFLPWASEILEAKPIRLETLGIQVKNKNNRNDSVLLSLTQRKVSSG